MAQCSVLGVPFHDRTRPRIILTRPADDLIPLRGGDRRQEKRFRGKRMRGRVPYFHSYKNVVLVEAGDLLNRNRRKLASHILRIFRSEPEAYRGAPRSRR